MRELNCPSCGSVLLVGLGGASEPACSEDRGLSRSDRDQTASDHGQTLHDQDQTSSGSARSTCDGVQRRADADADRRTADGDFAGGADRSSYRRSVLAREESGRERGTSPAMRDEAAASRQRTASDRDAAAVVRDRGAETRDATARRDDLADDPDATRDDMLIRGRRDRQRAAVDRARSADDRSKALTDRKEAANDRADAHHNRAEQADHLRRASMDELTGAITRQFGLAAVQLELERAGRTGEGLMLAFLDVDGLKQLNDTRGHIAGDALLRLVGETIRAHVRPYDVTVRYGGDELICAMPNLSAPDARTRFKRIAGVLSGIDPDHSITFGLAAFLPGETLSQLIERADADLLETRRITGRPA